jgi:hypothetical protein
MFIKWRKRVNDLDSIQFTGRMKFEKVASLIPKVAKSSSYGVQKLLNHH